MERKYKFRYVTSVPFEKEIYDRFISLLPKGVTASDEFNEFIKQRAHDLEKDKNNNVPNKCAIRSFENTIPVCRTVVKQKQLSNFNVYGSTDEMIAHVNGLDDHKEAWLLTRKTKLLVGLAETRAKNLEKEHICAGH